MNYIQKFCTVGVCLLSLGAVSSAQAKSAQVTNAQLQNAYQQLVLSEKRKNTRISSAVRKKRLYQKQFSARQRAVITAKQQLRKRYRWGGTTPRRGFDCSGLMQYAYKSANIKIPRTAAQQYKHTKRIPLSRMQVGDLVFFHTRNRRSRARINHVGIYLGNGNFIHAPRSGKRVSVAKLNSYWKRRAVGAGRV